MQTINKRFNRNINKFLYILSILVLMWMCWQFSFAERPIQYICDTIAICIIIFNNIIPMSVNFFMYGNYGIGREHFLTRKDEIPGK